MSKNAIIALAVTGGVVITGYFVYRYYQQRQANAQSQANQSQNPGSLTGIESIISTVGKSGGITGVIGSLF